MFRLLDATKSAGTDPQHPAIAFAKEVERAGSRTLIRNVDTEMGAIVDGATVLPFSVNDREPDNCYVCSNVTYAKYVKQELSVLKPPTLRRVGAVALDGVAALMRRGRMDQVVNVNNWLLSTNVYPVGYRPGIEAITGALVKEFPEHLICFRSVSQWTSRDLPADLARAGYHALPFRPCYVFDDVKAAYDASRNMRRDIRRLEKSQYQIVDDDKLSDADIAKLENLYGKLYIDKHSNYNPQLTTAYFAFCRSIGLLRIRALRARDGGIVAFAGFLHMPGAPPVPQIVGYETSLDQKEGLYRMAMALIFQTAIDNGWPIHLSSGAAEFKKLRGARAMTEYLAFYDGHLPAARRLAMRCLTMPAMALGPPLMKRFEV